MVGGFQAHFIFYPKGRFAEHGVRSDGAIVLGAVTPGPVSAFQRK